MKTEKKHLGITHKIREKKWQRVGVVLIAMIFFSILILNSMLNQSSTGQTVSSNSQLEVAIVDQLSLIFPNQTFIETATNTLERAGYNVDYYAGDQVTPEFYRNLPTHGYKILVLRVHSLTGTFQGKQMVGFFTSELYSTTSYVYEQLTDQIGCLGYYPGAQTRYFGISQEFVKSSMKGKFQNAVIIAMGCEGLNNTKMAEAFVEKGAKAYIGWDGSVTSEHTDKATTRLLQHLVNGKETVRQAVESTMSDVGPDPQYYTQLACYP